MHEGLGIQCSDREKLNSKLKWKFLQFCQSEIPFAAKNPDTETFPTQTSVLQVVCFSVFLCIKKELRAKADGGCARGFAGRCCVGWGDVSVCVHK